MKVPTNSKARVVHLNTNISVIIPTLNGGKELSKLLQLIKLQTINVQEVIIIDSESIDSTVQVAKSFNVKVFSIQREYFDHGGTRNFAAARAVGDILIFMTQDALPENENTFENLIKPLENPKIVVSYARQLPKPNTKITDQFLRLYNYPSQSLIKSEALVAELGIKTFQNSNVCAAYRKKEFARLGGFEEAIVSNEDMLFAAKAIFAGYKVAYCAEARVLHSHNYTFRDIFKRYFDIGASLDNNPLIARVGKAESKGLDFIKKQIKYIKQEKAFASLHYVLLEAICKYAGYKLGENHQHLPPAWKKHLGLNKGFWSR